MTTQNTLLSPRRLSLAAVLAAGALGLTACAGAGESAPVSAASSAVSWARCSSSVSRSPSASRTATLVVCRSARVPTVTVFAPLSLAST